MPELFLWVLATIMIAAAAALAVFGICLVILVLLAVFTGDDDDG